MVYCLGSLWVMSMITEDEILKYGQGNEKIFYGIEKRIMEDIVRRIKKTEKITSTADYQLNVLIDLGYSSEDIKKELTEALGKSEEYINKLYESVLTEEYVRNKAVYDAKGVEFIPFEENPTIKNILEGVMAQTGGTMNNLTQTMGFVVNVDGKSKFMLLSEYYRRKMDEIVMDIATGSFDYNTTLKKAIKEMTNSGVRWIDYNSGWHNRITVASRRAVMTGLSQIAQGVNDYNADRLDTNYFEVTAHSGARPSHAIWQGKVYTKEELYSVCGLGTVTGLLGANCYHLYYPFFKGLSVRAYTDAQLKEYRRNDTHFYNGKEISQYEASQIMRKKETDMRAQREKIHLMKIGGADKDAIMIERSAYYVQLHNYKFIADMFDLRPKMDRVYIDGLGRV